MKNHKAALTAITTAILAAACGGSDGSTVTPTPASKIVNFSATLSPSQETPTPTGNPQGSGIFSATLDTSTNEFKYTVTFSGMSPNVTAGHIHGPAGPGVPASVILNFATLANGSFTTGATSGSASGTTTLNATNISGTVNGDSLKKLLFAGLTYVNIHTTTNGAGEIRGQITKQ